TGPSTDRDGPGSTAGTRGWLDRARQEPAGRHRPPRPRSSAARACRAHAGLRGPACRATHPRTARLARARLEAHDAVAEAPARGRVDGLAGDLQASGDPGAAVGGEVVELRLHPEVGVERERRRRLLSGLAGRTAAELFGEFGHAPRVYRGPAPCRALCRPVPFGRPAVCR